MNKHFNKYKYFYIFLTFSFTILSIISFGFEDKKLNIKDNNKTISNEIDTKKIMPTTSSSFISYMNENNTKSKNEPVKYYFDNKDGIQSESYDNLNNAIKKDSKSIKNLVLLKDKNNNTALIDKSTVNVDEFTVVSLLQKENPINDENIKTPINPDIEKLKEIIKDSKLEGGVGYFDIDYFTDKNYSIEKDGIEPSFVVKDSMGLKFNTGINVDAVKFFNYDVDNLTTNSTFMDIYKTFNSIYIGSDKETINSFYSNYINNLNNNKFLFSFDKNVSVVDYYTENYNIKLSIFYKNSKVIYKIYSLVFLNGNLDTNVKENVLSKLSDVYGYSLLERDYNIFNSYITTSLDSEILYVNLDKSSINIQFN